MDKQIQGFEDLNVWKDAMQLGVAIYKQFRICKDFGFKNQIQELLFLSLQILPKAMTGRQIKSLFNFYILHEVHVQR